MRISKVCDGEGETKVEGGFCTKKYKKAPAHDHCPKGTEYSYTAIIDGEGKTEFCVRKAIDETCLD